MKPPKRYLFRSPLTLSLAALVLLSTGSALADDEAKNLANKAAKEKSDDTAKEKSDDTAKKKSDDTAKKKAKPARKPNPAMARITDVEGLPRVLLIGDSISIGYTVAVRNELQGIANVHRPLANCGPTTRGLTGIENWLKTGGEDKKWDIIHFNWGLHDLKYMGPEAKNLADPAASDSVQQVPPVEYEKNLRALVERLEKTGATLIWRNTTPVPEGATGRLTGDSVKYNKIAAKVMAEHDIATDDLYSLAKEKMAEIMLPANVHFKREGSELLGTEVAGTIKAALEKR